MVRVSQGEKRALQGSQGQILGDLPIHQAGVLCGKGATVRRRLVFKEAYLQCRFALLPMGMDCPAQVARLGSADGIRHGGKNSVDGWVSVGQNGQSVMLRLGMEQQISEFSERRRQ